MFICWMITMLKTPGQAKFISALNKFDAEGALDKIVLISASSLRILGMRVHTYFIDFLTTNSYYLKKAEEVKFAPIYELQPLMLNVSGFPMRIGTVKEDLCSFRHLVSPFNIYEEVEFKLGGKVRMIKIRPRNYVRKDCEEAISRLLQGSNEKYWQELYNYHKQIEAIDLGMSEEKLKINNQKIYNLEI
jgi:hypothetical protein